MVINQYDIVLVTLDPTIGHEIKKCRPCVVISPDEANRHLGTIIIAPMTSTSKDYPSRVSLKFLNRRGSIVLDQIRSVDKQRLVRKLSKLGPGTIDQVKAVIKEMLVD